MLATSPKEIGANYHNYYWRAKLEDIQPEATSGAKEKCLALWILRSLRNPVFAMFLGSGIELGTSVNK